MCINYQWYSYVRYVSSNNFVTIKNDDHLGLFTISYEDCIVIIGKLNNYKFVSLTHQINQQDYYRYGYH